MRHKHTLANAQPSYGYYITQIVNPNLNVELAAVTLKKGTRVMIHFRTRTEVYFRYWDEQYNEHEAMLDKNTASHFILNC